MSETLTGAQALIRALELEGVDTIFGVPGGAILPAYDPILDSPIRHVLARHEQGAGHMASGYAHASGKGRRGDGDIGAGSDEPDHRPPGRLHGLDPAGGGDRPGRNGLHRLRRLPGGAHLGHLDAVHQAQLPGHRARDDRRRDSRGIPSRLHRTTRARAGGHPQEHPQRHAHLAGSWQARPARVPAQRGGPSQAGEGGGAVDRRVGAPRPLPGGRGDPGGCRRRGAALRRAGQPARGHHADGPRRHPRLPPALPGDAGHARQLHGDHRHATRRRAHRRRGPFRRPGHRRRGRLRTPRQGRPRRRRPRRDRQGANPGDPHRRRRQGGAASAHRRHGEAAR